jgi:hypothetical protein
MWKGGKRKQSLIRPEICVRIITPCCQYKISIEEGSDSTQTNINMEVNNLPVRSHQQAETANVWCRNNWDVNKSVTGTNL